ncbi:zinc-binding alcohol dehydrogenase family protein [[Empedobacter] haloabium]|uniref:Zinc-binding alcohol dehydrogenase family protein n=1 Tax=[Empedobacter] haloabium TaxID=592317 RepID=A0ABZ1ULV3_9BURK
MKALIAMGERTARQVAALETCNATLHGTTVHFALVERPDIDLDPADPDHAHDVLVRVHAFSCNYREKGRLLQAARREAGGYLVLGSEFAGTVVKVGAAVDDLRPGDRVFGNGAVDVTDAHPGLTTQRASQQLQVLPRAKLLRFPAAMPFATAAAFSVGAQTAYALVRRLRPARGAQVAVTAASSNTALFAIAALVARGHDVHALTTSADSVPALRALGVRDCCVLAREQPAEPLLQAYLAAHGLAQFDAVIDPFMDIYLRKLVRHLRRGGTYITCGVYQQFSEDVPDAFMEQGLPLDEVFSLIIRKNLGLIGNNLGTTGDLEEALADYTAGRLPVPLDTVVGGGALAHFVERTYLARARGGKVVFTYSQEDA